MSIGQCGSLRSPQRAVNTPVIIRASTGLCGAIEKLEKGSTRIHQLNVMADVCNSQGAQPLGDEIRTLYSFAVNSLNEISELTAAPESNQELLLIAHMAFDNLEERINDVVNSYIELVSHRRE
jgi:hypothetical protein